MMTKIIAHLLDVVFPVHCVCCKYGVTALCSACEVRLINLTGSRLNVPAAHINRLIVCADYQERNIQTLIESLKFMMLTDLAAPLARLMRHNLTLQHLDPQTVLVPIPLHPRKQKRRGFNQSELLARELAVLTGLKVSTGLKRLRYTQSQTRLSARERRRNVQGVFTFTESRAPRSVLLVDDVATTCATLSSAAQELKRCGAHTVDAIVLGRNKSSDH